MVDDLAGLIDESEAPAETPAQTEGVSPDQASSSNVEERIRGFQRLLADRDQKLDAIQRQLEDQRLSVLPEDQRETALKQRHEREVLELRQKLELAELEKKYPPDVFGAYRDLLASKSAAAQLDFLNSKIRPTSKAKVAQEPPAVDLNNPMRGASGQDQTTNVFGTPMTLDQANDHAMRILRGASRIR